MTYNIIENAEETFKERLNEISSKNPNNQFTALDLAHIVGTMLEDQRAQTLSDVAYDLKEREAYPLLVEYFRAISGLKES